MQYSSKHQKQLSTFPHTTNSFPHFDFVDFVEKNDYKITIFSMSLCG